MGNKQCHPYLKDLEIEYTCYTSNRTTLQWIFQD